MNEHKEAVLSAARVQASVERLAQALQQLEAAFKTFNTKLGETK